MKKNYFYIYFKVFNQDLKQNKVVRSKYINFITPKKMYKYNLH